MYELTPEQCLELENSNKIINKLAKSRFSGPKYKDGKEVIKKTESFFQNGESVDQLATYLGVSYKTITRWAEKHDDFKEVLEFGKTKAKAIWEEWMRQASLGLRQGVNASIFNLSMVNRHGYTSRTDITSKDESIDNRSMVVMFPVEQGPEEILKDAVKVKE